MMSVLAVDVLLATLLILGLVLNAALIGVIRVGRVNINSIEILQLTKSALVICGLLLSWWSHLTDCDDEDLMNYIICEEMKGVMDDVFLYSSAWSFLAVGIVRVIVCKCKGQASTLITGMFSVKVLLLCLIPPGLSIVVRLFWIASKQITTEDRNKSIGNHSMDSSFTNLDIIPAFCISHLLLIIVLPLVSGGVAYLRVFRAITWTVRLSEQHAEGSCLRIDQEHNRHHSRKIMSTVIVLLSTTFFAWICLIIAIVMSSATHVPPKVLAYTKEFIFVLHPIGEGLFQESKRKRFLELCPCSFRLGRKACPTTEILDYRVTEKWSEHNRRGMDSMNLQAGSGSQAMSTVQEEVSMFSSKTFCTKEATSRYPQLSKSPPHSSSMEETCLQESNTYLTQVVLQSNTLEKTTKKMSCTQKDTTSKSKLSTHSGNRVHFSNVERENPRIEICESRNNSLVHNSWAGRSLEADQRLKTVPVIRRKSMPNANARGKWPSVRTALKKMSAPSKITPDSDNRKKKNQFFGLPQGRETEMDKRRRDDDLSLVTKPTNINVHEESGTSTYKREANRGPWNNTRSPRTSDLSVRSDGPRGFHCSRGRRGTYGNVENFIRHTFSSVETSEDEEMEDCFTKKKHSGCHFENDAAKTDHIDKKTVTKKTKIRSISCVVGANPTKLDPRSRVSHAVSVFRRHQDPNKILVDLTNFF